MGSEILQHYENTNIKVVPGCFAVIKNLKGEILTVIEGDTRSWKRSGQIGLPGGKIESEELPIEAIMREVREETNIDIAYSGLQKKKNIPDFYMFDYKNIIPIWTFNIKLTKEIVNIKTNMSNEILNVLFMSEEDIMSTPKDKLRPGIVEAIFASDGREIKDVILINDGLYQKNPLL
ncbi:MAG TPA: NUDIX hydrolase [Candidatus Absconditabacterales bacterium]|nr:NUDIX hydrolase [Candidatus Absconditabacterales bacterium]HMT27169.1 NUDIX hydrolase [Candidatus Absconditabacterales bacterium]